MTEDKLKTKKQLLKELKELREMLKSPDQPKAENAQAPETSAINNGYFQSLFQDAPLAYHSLDIRGNFIIVNQSWLEQLGYTSEEVVGRNFVEFLTPKSRELFHERFQKFKERGEIHDVEFELFRKDGTVMTIKLDGKNAYDENSEFEQTHCIFVDISEKKQLQENLRIRERQQAAVAELGQHALVSTKLSGLFDEAMAKAAQALEVEYFKMLELLPGGESVLLRAGVGWRPGLVGQAVVPVGSNSQISFTFQSRNPIIVRDLRTETRFAGPQLLTDHNVVSGMSVIIGNFENPWGILCAHTTKQRDFSEDDIFFMQSVANLLATAIVRKKSEDERLDLESKIQHTQKLESLGVLAGGIAHDFNNILMTVLGNADLAMQELTAASPSHRYLQDIKTAAIRAADLCRQMLAYSGRGRFVITTIDLQEAIEEMVHMLEISISKKAVLKFDFADNLPPIEADATQIRQLIMNLITNASEAIGDRSGVISISAGAMRCNRAYLKDTFLGESLKEGMYLYIEVADTGCGMDKKTVELMFEPFFTTKFTGRGLGMAAVLGIMRGHKGAIKIYSELGKGTTIKLLFPAVDSIKAPPKLSEADKSIAKEDSIGRGTILLVDDEEAILAIVGEMLGIFGFKVITASDGREAVEIYKQRKDEISCVLLDLTMPHMDGEEAFRELRQINKNVRVIISSGFNQQEVTQRFLGKGLAGFIEKPYQMKALKEKLKEVLD